MLRRTMMLLPFLAACHSATAPKPPLLDPPAALDLRNETGSGFVPWVLIIGADAVHTGAWGDAGYVIDTVPPHCAYAGQVPGERQFLMLAVMPFSPLDSALGRFTNDRGPATDAWMDSLAKGSIDLPAFYAAHPGLIAGTAPFDPAPVGWPADSVVPWRWTVTGPGAATIVLDTADHTCTR